MTTTYKPADNKISNVSHSPPTGAKPLSASVRRGALWSVASAVQLRSASIITTAVVAHILDPQDFGIFAVAMTAYTIVFSLGEFGIASCLSRADLDIDSLAPTMNTVSITTSIVQGGALAIFAKQIATALGSSAAVAPIRALALVVIITGFVTVPSARLFRDFRQEKVFLAEAISVVAATLVLLLLAKSGSGAMAFAWSRVAGQLISGCVVFASAPNGYRLGFSRNALSVLFAVGIPLGFAGFVNYILLNVDYALIGHLLGAAALGVYVLAFNIASWPSSLLGFMISNVSMPAFSRVKEDPDQLTSAVASALRAISLVVMPMSALTMALARPLVLTVYGGQWVTSAEVLSILTLYGAISIICLLFANILAGLGKVKLLLLIQMLWITALIPAMVIGVHLDGIFGAAFAHIAIIGPVVLPIYLVALRRTTGVRFAALAKAILSVLLASSAAALAARGIESQFARLTSTAGNGSCAWRPYLPSCRHSSSYKTI